MRTAHRRAGFSLIEILITLGVISLLATIVMVNFGGVTQSERLRSAARKLAGMSDWIRSQSAATQRTSYLDIDFDRSQFRFRQEPPRDVYGRFVSPEDPERPITEIELEEWRESFRWESLPHGVFFKNLWINDHHYYEKDVVEVEYKPNGTLNSFILWLQAPGDGSEKDAQWFSVSVNGLSGKSEVLDDRLKFASANEGDFQQVMGNELPGGDGK